VPYRALKKSHDQEKRLIKKCRELNAEVSGSVRAQHLENGFLTGQTLIASQIVNNAAKVQTALKLSQEDQATNASLRKEIEKAWSMVDVAQDKEVRNGLNQALQFCSLYS